MHGRTYNVLKPGTVVTVWGESRYSGQVGETVERRPPYGILIRLKNGIETVEGYKNVAVGDNSEARFPEGE